MVCCSVCESSMSFQAASSHKVSFPFFMAFNSLLTNMELSKRIYLNASGGSRTQEVTKGTCYGNLFLLSDTEGTLKESSLCHKSCKNGMDIFLFLFVCDIIPHLLLSG